MNSEQKFAYEDMINGHNVFITGGGGVGKTYVISKFYDDISPKKVTYLTSTTGISALNIGGQTLHSLLGIGLGKGEVKFLERKIKKNRKTEVWTTIKVLIIDEISMLDPEVFDKIDKLAKLIRKNDKPFGGIQVVLSGDFCQLPCIKSENFCFEAKSWKTIEKVHYLKNVVRQQDEKFVKVLNSIRLGIIDKEVKEVFNSRIKPIDEKSEILPTRIYPYNKQVDIVNFKHLSKIQKEGGHKLYRYKTDLEISDNYKGSCVVNEDEVLELTVGVQVILTANLSVAVGLANGSMGIVVGFDCENLPIVRFKNVTQVIDYKEYVVEENKQVLYTYLKMPLKLAYAISIHKSQGMTLECIETDISNIFEYGQAYVCLSRVKSLEGLFIKNINYYKIKCHPKAKKYYESL